MTHMRVFIDGYAVDVPLTSMQITWGGVPEVHTCCACEDRTPLAFGAHFCPACKHAIRAADAAVERAARRLPRRVARRAHHRPR